MSAPRLKGHRAVRREVPMTEAELFLAMGRRAPKRQTLNAKRQRLKEEAPGVEIHVGRFGEFKVRIVRGGIEEVRR